MIKRKRPVKHKKTPNIFSHYLDGKGQHHFRVPNQGVRVVLVSLLQGADMERLKELDTQREAGDTPDAMAMAIAYAPFMGYAGAVVGAYWAHETKELETGSRADLFADPVGYSDNVLAELEAEGYNQMHIMQLFSACMEHTPKEVSEAEVEATADFLPRPEEPHPSLPSTMD